MSEKWLWYIPLTQSALAGDNTCRAYGKLLTFSSFKCSHLLKELILLKIQFELHALCLKVLNKNTRNLHPRPKDWGCQYFSNNNAREVSVESVEVASRISLSISSSFIVSLRLKENVKCMNDKIIPWFKTNNLSIIKTLARAWIS